MGTQAQPAPDKPSSCITRQPIRKHRCQDAALAAYDLMVAREMGNWEVVTTLGKQLNLSLYAISQTYNEAMRWAHAITSVKGGEQGSGV